MRRLVQDSADKSTPVHFGLLVIPVDFQDQRFDLTFDRSALAARVLGDGEASLARYFELASGGRTRLYPLLAPVVHLPGNRADYSDIGWHGFSHTRRLAFDSLQALAALGLDFALLDDDGPDGLPGSGDDDGMVDGVLILHAGPGQENDQAEGLIQPLQYFLSEPVYQGGVGGSFYAVASLASGPGIWAHETGHLMGMEDRYDFSLAPGGQSEVVSRGGLGRFSLMAAGAWGTGGGVGAAMPDAYTLVSLGWASVLDLKPSQAATVILRPPVSGGTVGRVVVPGTQGREYFLLETRSSIEAEPFDAQVPSGQLLVYHVDESLSEGQSNVDQLAGRHLRVSLVEADGDLGLLDGLDLGSLGDVFPGSGAVVNVPATGYPGLGGYAGDPGLGLGSVATRVDGVNFMVVPQAAAGLTFTFGSGPGLTTLDLVVQPTGRALADLTCRLGMTATTWGTFVGGAMQVTVSLVDDGQGNYRPDSPVAWNAATDLPPGAATEFQLHFQGAEGFVQDEQRSLIWRNDDGVLDFQDHWPGSWMLNAPGPDDLTSWQHWESPAAPAAEPQAVLVCTGTQYASDAAWPDIHYENSGTAWLTSGPLGEDVAAVRIIHAIEVEYLSGDVVMDGGLVRWRGADGRIVAAEPVGGFPARVSPRAISDLQGQAVFACDSLSFRDDHVVWQTDVVPVPQMAAGPWRLEFVFASNSLWRRRGWLLAAVTPLPADADLQPFAAHWEQGPAEGRNLVWTWPWADAIPLEWVVQYMDPQEKRWKDAGTVPASSGQALAEGQLRGMLPLASKVGVVRMLGQGTVGWLATRPVAMGLEGGTTVSVSPLSLPWPNPGHAPIRLQFKGDDHAAGQLVVYDIAGRQVATQNVPQGRQLLLWDGLDARGGPAPAGVYFFRLEGYPGSVTRKVVLLR